MCQECLVVWKYCTAVIMMLLDDAFGAIGDMGKYQVSEETLRRLMILTRLSAAQVTQIARLMLLK